MSQTTIEWAAHLRPDGALEPGNTWNPVTGCTRASAGCDNCYAVRVTQRIAGYGNEKYAGLVNSGKSHFNGVVKCHEADLAGPLRKRKATTYFVNSMSDLFHDRVPFDFIDKVFAVMAMCPEHKFLVLTKRADRMEEYFKASEAELFDRWQTAACATSVGNSPCAAGLVGERLDWPLANVGLGVSVEDQEQVEKRIPPLLRVPAAMRFLSCEPLLGPLVLPLKFCGKCFGFTATIEVNNGKDWGCAICKTYKGSYKGRAWHPESITGIDWVIVGGESGHNARPINPKWVRRIREQCKEAEVPFFFKQWGEYEPYRESVQPPFWEDTKGFLHDGHGLHFNDPVTGDLDPKRWHPLGQYSKTQYRKVGKHIAGRQLDSQEYNARPLEFFKS